MINSPSVISNNAVGNQTQDSVDKPNWHHEVSKAMQEYEKNPVPTSRADLSDSVKIHLKNAGDAVFTEQSHRDTEHIALASLVNLAAQGGPLGEEACEVLFNACDRAYLAKGPSNKGAFDGVKRIEKVGAKALAAFVQAQKDGKVEKMPVDLLHVAWQQAKNEGTTVLAEHIKWALESKLGASASALVQDPSIALEEIKEVARGTYGGTLVKGLGVVDLSGKPPTDAQREDWFKDLKEGQQRPVSFKLDDNTFVHGFVHIDAKGKQHIVVVSNNPDKDFGARFAKALGLPEESCTMEKLSGLGACKGMSEAGLAKWLFSYCAAHGGGTKDVVQKFQKHVQDFDKQGIVDFTEAQRVRRLAAEGSKSPSKQMTKDAVSVKDSVGGSAKAMQTRVGGAQAPDSGSSESDAISQDEGEEKTIVENDSIPSSEIDPDISTISANKRATHDQLKIEGEADAKEGGCLPCFG